MASRPPSLLLLLPLRRRYQFRLFQRRQRLATVQTAYDYDAPVDELGRVKPKFKALRDLFIQTLHIAPPPIPADPKSHQIPKFQISNHRPLLNSLPKPTLTSDDVVTMEDLDQSYGLIDYRKSFPNGVKGKLDLRKAWITPSS